MRDQNQRLKSAIEKLINTTRGDEDPELLNTIFNVAEAAGIDAQRPAGLSDDDTAQSGPRPRHSKPVSGGSNRSIFTSADIKDGEEGEGGNISIDVTTRDIVRKAGDGDHQTNSSYLNASTLTSTPTSPYTAATPPPQQQRLACNIWLDHLHYMRVSIPPDDILPYVGSGSKTFAGILFWSAMDHTQMQCTRKQHSNNASLIRRALGHSQVTVDWAVSYILAMVEARQEYKRTGSISSEYASFAEQDLGMVVCDRISAEYLARGKNPDMWLSTLGIERRVRGMLGDEAFGLLDLAARGEGDAVLRGLFEDLKCSLHETGICFGDGPRWNVDVVDALFLDWVRAAFWSA